LFWVLSGAVITVALASTLILHGLTMTASSKATGNFFNLLWLWFVF